MEIAWYGLIIGSIVLIGYSLRLLILHHKKTHYMRSLIFIGCGLLLWHVMQLLSLAIPYAHDSVFLVRTLHYFAAVMGPLYYIFILDMMGKQYRKIQTLVIASCFLLIYPVIFSDLVIGSYTSLSGIWPGVWYGFYVIYVLMFMILGFATLIYFYSLDKQKRVYLDLFLVFVVTGVLQAMINVMTDSAHASNIMVASLVSTIKFMGILFILSRYRILRLSFGADLVLGIRQKVWLSILSIIVILVLMGSIITFGNLQKVSRQKTQEHLDSVSELKMRMLDDYQDRSQEALISLSEDIAKMDRPLADIGSRSYIDMLREYGSREGFEEIFVMDREGIIVFSTDPSQVGKIRRSEKYLRSGLKSAYVSSYHYDLEDNEPAVVISAPIEKGNASIGVVAGKLDLSAVNSILTERRGLGDTGETYLVDGLNYMVTPSRFRDDTSHFVQVKSVPIQRCLEKEEGSGVFRDYRDVEVFSDYVWLESLKVCLITEIDLSEVYSDYYEARNVYIVSVVLLVAIFSIFAIHFGDELVAPIVTLRDAMMRFSKGHPARLKSTGRRDEIGELFRSFKSLVKEIEISRKKLENANKTLEMRVEQRTRQYKEKAKEAEDSRLALLNMMEDLVKANEDLKELDKAKSNFLNIVSHELKTPLTAIIAHLSLLSDSKFKKEEQSSLDAISRNASTLRMLIENILEIARIEADRFELNPEKIDIRKAIGDAVGNLKVLADRKGLKLKVHISSRLPKYIYTDPARFREVMNNLLSNAIKFTDKGSIKVDAMRDKKFMKVKVKDTGIGIPKKKMRQLFEKFYQVDASLGRRYGGSGLGLSITKQLVELQGGTVDVKSAEGKGSEFSFRLPLKRGGKR